MTDVEIDVGLVEAEFEVAPVSVELTVAPTTVELTITPPDLFEIDVGITPTIELTISTNDVSVVVNPPPLVNFTVGGGTGGGDGVCYVPVGGASGDVLSKRTDADLDVQWAIPGIHTYRTPDTLPNEPLFGDLWINADNNNTMSRWDGVVWVDIHDQNIDLAIAIAEGNADDIASNQGEIADLHQELDSLSVTTDNAEKAANTADGRISMSDYEPTPNDVTYPVVKPNPDTGEDEVIDVPRVEGSLWFQRTRPRQNLVSNPSFEKNANGWQATNATLLRWDPTEVPVLAGDYCLQITSTALGNAVLEPSYSFAADESEWYAGSMYLMKVSGSGAGCFVTLAFYDVGNSLLLSVTGEVEDLVGGTPDPDNWNRLNAVAKAPPGTKSLRFAVHNPNPNDVWYAGVCIVENLDELGKYFDGDSYDGFWEGGTGDPLIDPDDNPVEGEQGWQESTSRLYGDKIIGIWELHSGIWVRKVFADSTLDYIDARKIINLEEFYPFDNSITTDKLNVPEIVASENLGAGDIVSIYNLDGAFQVRRANASAGANYPASGFVLDDVVAGSPARVYKDGTDLYRLSMSPGPQWLAEAPGAVTELPPSTIGCIVQQVGYAADLFYLNFAPLLPIKIT